MNRTYRLVWNAALRVVQVASELSSSPRQEAGGGDCRMPVRHPLFLALIACGLFVPVCNAAAADQCHSMAATPCGAAGGIGGSPRAADGGTGNGVGGGAMNLLTGFKLTGHAAIDGVGGAGVSGVDVDGNVYAAGGTGGGLGVVAGNTVTGGSGGNGGDDAHAPGSGGGGGAGALVAIGSAASTVVDWSYIGGRGGDGGNPGVSAGGAGGGGGGAGIVMGSAFTGTLTISSPSTGSSRVVGGAGGNGGELIDSGDTWGGGGGGGGDGVVAFAENAKILVQPDAEVIGGAGGAGGFGSVASGTDGESGAGIRALAAGLTLTNAGSISGGDGTGGGAAGVGVVTRSGASITNAGSISGGLDASGRASAVLFNGAGSTLSLQNGSTVVGAVELASGASARVASLPAGILTIDGAKLNPGSQLDLYSSQASSTLDLGSTITGTGNVTSSGAGTLTLRYVDLAGSMDLQNLAGVTIADAIVSTTLAQRYRSNVNLAMDSQLISAGGSVVFDSTLGGAHSLVVGAPTGSAQFDGPVNLPGSATLTVRSRSLAIGTVQAGGIDFDVTNGITQTGPFTINGSSKLTSIGDVTLTNAANAFNGDVQIQANNATISAGGDLDVSSLSVAPLGDITLHGSTITLPANGLSTGGDISLSGSVGTADLSARSITISGGSSLAWSDSISATSTLVLDQASNITQLAGSITAGTLEAHAGGNIVLNSFGNAIAAVGDMTAGDVTLATATPLTFTGNVVVDTLNLSALGNATLTGSIEADQVNLGIGNLTVGNGGATGTLDADVAGAGALIFDRADTVTFSRALRGSGSLVQAGSGKLQFDGDGSGFLGGTTVQNGGLVVGSTAGSGAVLAGPVHVESGASLGGHGLIEGNVTIDGGATLSPGNSIGTLTVGGNLDLAGGSRVTFELGSSGVGDQVIVGGYLNLAGAIDVVDLGMAPGIYNLFSYGGALAVRGNTWGNMPPGRNLTMVFGFSGKQITLIDSTNVTLQYWNADGLAGPTQAGGGSGTWTRTSSVWTDDAGSFTGPMTPQPGFAIFGGAAGTVTVDDVDGAVSVAGMQFLSDGYTVAGDALSLAGSGGPVVIRVGDGSSSTAGHVATINSVLTGTQGLAKADAGTLVLGAANLYSGGTTILGGALAVGDDRNLGDAGNGVILDGGTLRVTGTAYDATGRALSLASGGGIDIADASNVFAWNGAIDGAGTLAKRGAGTLVLDAASTRSGMTIVEAGALRLGDDAAAGSGALSLRDGATLALARDGMIVGSAIDITGDASIDVDGTATLTADIVDGASSGSLTKTGAGTLRLTGDAAFSGVATIASGTLHIGDGGANGTLPGAIVDHGTLVLDRAGDVAFAGTLSGDGAFRKLGAGVLHFTGNGAGFSGETNIEAGTLQLDGVLSGTLSLSNGAVLAGTGTAGSARFAAGTGLSPGGRDAIGTLSFGGDLDLASGTHYTVDVTDAGQGDRVNVGGIARLGGGSVVSLATGGEWNTTARYTILSANGGVSGTFSDVSSNLAFLTPSLAYSPNAVELTLERNDVAFPDVATTRNQRAAAGGAESLGEGVPVYDAIMRLDAAGAVAAFDELSGEFHANLRGAIVDDDRHQRDVINQHLIAQHADMMDDAPAGWAAAWGHWARHDADGNASRLRADGSGVLLGADTGVGATRLGFALGTGRLSASANGDDADIDTRTAGLYGSGRYGNVLMQAGVLYSDRDIKTHRNVDVDGIGGRINGRQDARSTQAYIEGAYAFAFDGGSIDPYLSVARQQLRTDAMRERGGDAALHVMGEEGEQTFATLGVRGHRSVSAKHGVELSGSVGWLHAWGDIDMLSRQRFASGGDAFVVAGTPIAEDSAVATLSLRYRASESVTLEAAYSGQFADEAQDQSARVLLNWTF